MKAYISATAVIAALIGLVGCRDAGPLAPTATPLANAAVLGNEGILPLHGELTGGVVAFYTMANPAHRATILAHCDPGAVAYVQSAGSGVWTHLGHTQAAGERCQYSAGWWMRMTLTAANGDQIFATFTGTGGVPDAEGKWVINVPVHATEGTGRFAHVVLDATWTGGGRVSDGSMWSVVDGTIQYDARDRAEQ